MNIFKILASGDGSINEPNVSAFLAYLLDCFEDHGLRDEFLRRILRIFYSLADTPDSQKYLVKENDEITDLSANSNFEIEVFLEQAFHSLDSKTKQIVDIVILIFEKENYSKESYAKELVKSKSSRTLRKIFLIENKIRENSISDQNQLINQYNYAIQTLSKEIESTKLNDNILDLISFIFISPDGPKSKNAFENFEKVLPNCPKAHILWNNNNGIIEYSEDPIIAILKEIIFDSQNGEIEPIHSECLYLLKSFINFIECDFKSKFEEKTEGKFTREIEYNFVNFSGKKRHLFTTENWTLIESLSSYLKKEFSNKITQRHSTSHPISIFLNDSVGINKPLKIFSISKKGSKLEIKILYKRLQESDYIKSQIEEYLKNSKIESKSKDNKFFIPCDNFELNKIIKLFTFYIQQIEQKTT
ncbi:hypothetical protein [Leptospira paudalimensis]|uniref:Uncharacterized protein n=1 Tax=Leptospira paudalimensis TaxID=2950024 RepID=A0ABT3MCJ4_9LEPT|nr:hypothetical protein [Leptospira paudalimensis]MCW7506108.1 hypothetical protein [Leptospira paudalimensis]